jgi:hypothetical protein
LIQSTKTVSSFRFQVASSIRIDLIGGLQTFDVVDGSVNAVHPLEAGIGQSGSLLWSVRPQMRMPECPRPPVDRLPLPSEESQTALPDSLVLPRLHYDFFFPVDSTQIPFYNLLGPKKDQKKRIQYETGHNIPRNELIKEILNWHDLYLGPVQ